MRLDLNMIEAIRDEVLAIDPDDADLLADMIEGETDAPELMDALLEMDANAKAMIEANRLRVKAIQDRNARLDARAHSARELMQKLLNAAGQRKMERPEGTVSIRAVPPKVLGDNVDALPDDCRIVKYAPDRKAIKARLEAGETIEGWALSNGGETVAIRRG